MVADQDLVTCRVLNTNPLLKPNELFLNLKHNQFHTGIGIAGILTKPFSTTFPSFKEQVANQAEYALPTHKLVLLVHGHSAHKNGVYNQMLAAKLAEMGYYVLRIDFRSLGDSEPNADPSIGRTIQQDVQDIETVYQFACSEQCRQLLGKRLTLDTIVAHSRGVIAMLEFAMTRYIPNLINCAGRFVSHELYTKAKRRNPNWEKDGGFYCNAVRHGQLKKTFIPKSETASAADVDTLKFKQIDQRSFVLSVYGSRDDVIPLSASAKYSNLFQGRHTLEIIMEADHNFYGFPEDRNEQGLPLRKGKVNYNFVVVDTISQYLSNERQLDRFYEASKVIRSTKISTALTPRWSLPHDFSRISNFRDLGGYQTRYTNRRVKSGVLYRCANPCDATSEALDFMTNELHINKVFDLRSPQEAIENGIIARIQVENLAFNKSKNLSPDKIAKHYQGLLISSYKFPQAYMIVTKNSIPQIRTFFEYVLDGHCDDHHAVVFHCTAGKDRTGILGMLILGILGVDEDTIAREYELTTIGLLTEAKLIKKLSERGSLYYDMLGEGAENLAKDYKLTPEVMCQNLLSSTYEAMRLFIDDFNQEFGSVESFFLDILEFIPEDIQKIRAVLLE